MARTPDPTLFERTALPHLRDCYAFALSLCGRVADAEDLVQETFLKAQRAFSSYAEGTNIKAWLFTILRRLHIDGHRRAKVRPVTQSEDELDARGSSAPPPSGVEGNFGPADVWRALERVPDPFRMAVRLRDVDGLTYEEIGRLLDIPPGTVMSRLHRGREWLRTLLVASRTEPKGLLGEAPDAPDPP